MDNTNLEVEYKTLVTKDQLLKLLETYKPIETYDQTNHYFDSKPSLLNKGFAIRIREVNNKFIFTLKEIVSKGIIEHEFIINSLNINNPKIKKLLNNLNIVETLNYLGSLRTIRHLYKDEFGELCLDINEYNNITDYEVEYELINPKEDKLSHFISLLKMCGVNYVENKISKFQRFKDTI